MASYRYVAKEWATCSICGRKCKPREDGLCSICRQRGKAKQTCASHRSQRKCHDCKRPTTQYRCPACWAKLRKARGLPYDENILARLDEDFCYV